MRSRQKQAYGSWPSPIKPELLLRSNVGLGEISNVGNDLYWIEMRPEEKGRYVIVKQAGSSGIHKDISTTEHNARTRVHEYGGGSYLVTEQGVMFTNFDDQRLYWQTASQCQPVSTMTDCRYADMVYDPTIRSLICVREDHGNDSAQAENSIVSVQLDSGKETVLVSGHDFYSNPRLRPDGKQLCWIAWDHPGMPWDATALYLADLNSDGSLANIVRVTEGENESVCQPVWSPQNELYFVSDRTNWWNLYRYTDAGIEAILSMAAEFATPQWSFRETNYAFIDGNTLLAIYWRDGVATLARVDVMDQCHENIDLPYSDMESVCCFNDRAWLLGASPTSFPAIIEVNLSSGEHHVIRRANDLVLDDGDISKGEALTFFVGEDDNKQDVHGFYYAPVNKNYCGLDKELPPLIVISHGGPTGASRNGLKLVIQFFTSRGFAVTDVNYSGSTGYGRDYRDRLKGQWGVLDVRDCSQAALSLVAASRVDGNQLAIRGGSAGGFTTLAALTFTDVFKAGASHYGVSHLVALAKETHKFESHYLDTLIGPYPEASHIYDARSPVNAVDDLSCPVIFFQGLEDKIVLPNQAEMMVAALKKKKIPVAYLAYEGEQHGFRQAKNIKRTLEAELYFYSIIFGFDCADEIEPIRFE